MSRNKITITLKCKRVHCGKCQFLVEDHLVYENYCSLFHATLSQIGLHILRLDECRANAEDTEAAEAALNKYYEF